MTLLTSTETMPDARPSWVIPWVEKCRLIGVERGVGVQFQNTGGSVHEPYGVVQSSPLSTFEVISFTFGENALCEAVGLHEIGHFVHNHREERNQLGETYRKSAVRLPTPEGYRHILRQEVEATLFAWQNMEESRWREAHGYMSRCFQTYLDSVERHGFYDAHQEGWLLWRDIFGWPVGRMRVDNETALLYSGS